MLKCFKCGVEVNGLSLMFNFPSSSYHSMMSFVHQTRKLTVEDTSIIINKYSDAEILMVYHLTFYLLPIFIDFEINF